MTESLADEADQRYRQQHKRRLSYMPWFYFGLKAKHLRWDMP